MSWVFTAITVQNSSFEIWFLQSSTKKCYCDTDNCNKDDDCKSCDNQNPGIKCQVCNGADGECDNVEDMGESKECQSGEVCAFVINGNSK